MGRVVAILVVVVGDGGFKGVQFAIALSEVMSGDDI